MFSLNEIFRRQQLRRATTKTEHVQSGSWRHLPTRRKTTNRNLSRGSGHTAPISYDYRGVLSNHCLQSLRSVGAFTYHNLEIYIGSQIKQSLIT